jgi:L-threonylcarbamoyladenylate synthase
MTVEEKLKNKGVGVLATDTLYGLVGSALDESVIERIYKLKNRNTNKPSIILISDLEDLELFEIKVDDGLKKKLSIYWPGPVSIILPCSSDKFKYIHRGSKSLAFRVPNKKSLRQFLKLTGPLVAPSANPEGLPPAQTIEQAKQYFTDSADFYVAGKTTNKASRLIRVLPDKVDVIRK